MSFCQEIEIIAAQPHIEKCWKNLPGEFLPFFLLCQKPEGMSWDEILLAKDVIAPNAPDFSEWQLRQYAKFGYLRQKGKLWQIAESKAVLSASENNICQILFVGNPALLWSLYTEIALKHPKLLNEKKIVRVGKPTLYPLPPIQIVLEKKLPFLQMNWRDDQKEQKSTEITASEKEINLLNRRISSRYVPIKHRNKAKGKKRKLEEKLLDFEKSHLNLLTSKSIKEDIREFFLKTGIEIVNTLWSK